MGSIIGAGDMGHFHQCGVPDRVGFVFAPQDRRSGHDAAAPGERDGIAAERATVGHSPDVVYDPRVASLSAQHLPRPRVMAWVDDCDHLGLLTVETVASELTPGVPAPIYDPRARIGLHPVPVCAATEKA